MLNNNNERTRVRVRRSSRKAAAKRRRNTALLILLCLISFSLIGAMFGATPTGKYVASMMKDSVSRIFAESTADPVPGQRVEPLRRKSVTADADQMVLADRSVLNPLALPTIKDTYPEGDDRNWDVDALISRKRSPEDSSITDPMNPDRYGLGDQNSGSLSSTSLWSAISFQGTTGNFFSASVQSSRSGQSGARFGQLGSLSGGGIIPSGNPGDSLELYTLEKSGSGDNGIDDGLFDEPAQSGSGDRDSGQQAYLTPQPLPLYDVSQIAPNDEPLTPPASEDQTETLNAGNNDNGSVEVSEPATIAIFGIAALYLFGLRRSLTKKSVPINAVSA